MPVWSRVTFAENAGCKIEEFCIFMARQLALAPRMNAVLFLNIPTCSRKFSPARWRMRAWWRRERHDITPNLFATVLR